LFSTSNSFFERVDEWLKAHACPYGRTVVISDRSARGVCVVGCKSSSRGRAWHRTHAGQHSSKEPKVKQRKGIDRREFLQGSAALLGAGSFRSVDSSTARAPGRKSTSKGLTDNGRLKMNFAPGAHRKAWILAPAEAGFQERLASKELARGLRKLGLAHTPIEAAGSAVEARSDDIAFTLRVDNEAFKDPEA
jgi:hypothetical protein